ncbi:PREDICTED: WD repeat-containing protein 73-like isoform X2 [Amphimedon queenslandica]|uniref:WD repeat-containing protein 73 n=1 Tax=Amphimedon queenslandica TaxID=400682 RepID=A0AAN0K350_AMPQE|nr:PREDICTED: WD repeat-containing protein 73-like isoform X2 [Amphimedon queenslandica]|eukprot:XP_019863719.1 PREDICTED: WD repeat-containing protein 73-like isoform X2 [Amphimedon queenslandica]
MDDDDDWLISSLERYEQLFMYDLSTPVHLMYLASDKGVWVYGQTLANKRELSLLTLPTKITNKEITGGRDFKISAGAVIPFSINCIQEMSNQQAVLCNADKRSLHWWREDERSPDLLVEIASSIVPPLPHHKECETARSQCITHIDYWKSESNDQHLLLGSNSPPDDGHVQIYDVVSHSVSWETVLDKTKLHDALYFGSPHQIVLCSGNYGEILVVDTREPFSATPTRCSMDAETHDDYALSCTSNIIGTLSDAGSLRLYDSRSYEKPFYCCTMPTTFHSSQYLTLTISPYNDRLLGLHPGIIIYDTTSMPPKAIFTHDGHEKEGAESVKVHGHIWHQSIPRLLISAGSDGGLHMWQYNE